MKLEKLIDALAANAEKENKAETGDYIDDDGLLVCGKCGTRKQTIVEILGSTRTVSCMCKCKADAYKAEEERRKQEARNRRIMDLRRMGFPDGDLVNCTFENDDRQNERITNALQKYADNFRKYRDDGKGLLLWGDVGTGKTFYASCIANAVINQGMPALVTNFGRLTNIIGGTFEGKQNYIDSLNDFDLLVIDDLGVERRSEYMQEMIYNIIDSRYRSGLPLIITTNLTLDEIKKPAEMAYTRIYDRVLEMCHPIQIAGNSRRRAEVRRTYFSMNDELGL